MRSKPRKPAKPPAPAPAAKARALASTAKRARDAASRANKTRAKALLALIARRKGEIVEAFYDIGEALVELSEKKHYAALGHDSFKELLAKERVMSATQAFKLIKIVKNVARDTALSLGQEKAFALVGLTEATPEKDTVDDLADDIVDGKPLRDASRRAIERLADETRDKHHKPTKQEREDARALRDAVATVRRHFSALGLRGLEINTVGKRVRVELTVEQAAKLASDA